MRRLLPVLLLVAACGTAVPGAGPSAPGWTRLPDPPLAPRSLPVVAAVGGQVLVVGGDTAPPCPPGAGCVDPPERQVDGAALDLASRTWRPLPPAPVPPVGDSAVVGQALFVQTGWDGDDPLLALADGRWTEHPAPPGSAEAVFSLVAAGHRLVALRAAQRLERFADAVYDPATRTWTPLPPSPGQPLFDRHGTALPDGRVLVTGSDDVPQPCAGSEPCLLRALLLDPVAGTWEQLPQGELLGGAPVAVHAGRVVIADPGGADGGSDEWGRRVPKGAALDVAVRRWEPLKDPPAEGSGGWDVFADGGPVAAGWGWLYDDRDRSWTRLEAPDDGPEAPGPAAWAGDALVVVGGNDLDAGPYGASVREQGAWLLPVSWDADGPAPPRGGTGPLDRRD